MTLAPTLRDIEEWMAACVSPLTSLEARNVAAERLKVWFRLPASVDPDVRLAVHVNGYPARIREALAETFPAVAHVVGARAFTALTERYVAAVPLPSWNLNDAGDGLPLFLQSDELTNRFGFLPDLAELERRVSHAFHAPEAPPLDPAPLAAWPLEQWQRAVFRFQPSVSVVRSAWPIHDIWESRETELAEIDIEVRGRPQNVLVHRSGLRVHCKTVATGGAQALEELLAGYPLGDVIEKVVACGETPEAVFGWFAAWMRAGMITTVDGGAHS